MSDNPIDALHVHLEAWDSPNTFEGASGSDSAYEMLSEVMDDVRVLLAVEDATAVHPMVAAYHRMFDFKDSLDPNSPQYYRTYEALAMVARTMQDMGLNELIPQRYDAPREGAKASDDLKLLRAMTGMPFPEEL